MLNLSKRMLMAAKMVRKGNAVADIGTDHAYLPAYLILNGIAPKALACDVRKGPLENAKKTVEHYGIEDKITLRLSDGFDEIQPSEAEDFIMCGMGGTLMEQLVSRTHWLKDSSKRIIVQPQSHAEDIRRFFVENGFEILFEDACTDGGKLYCAMAAEYTGAKLQRPVSYIYTGELPKCQKKEARLYLENTVARLHKKLEAERVHGSAEYADYLEKIALETEEIINGMETDG
ncbi:MAG: SAM-dependent methyltransferase [Ruminococcaceae bacterium]|nr:SAM-dependent methyltransferase [Oscillospiraceae bacterium]